MPSKSRLTPSTYRYRLRRKLYSLRELGSSPAVVVAEAHVIDDSAAEAAAQAETNARELTEMRETIARQRAEFDNFRKRTQREKDQIREIANESLLSRLLPVLDNFDRALASAESAADLDSVRQGVGMIATQLSRALEAEGLTQINPLNAPFDPTKHDAIAAEPRDDMSENHVCAVLLPGYSYKDRLLRPAMVKVSKAG